MYNFEKINKSIINVYNGTNHHVLLYCVDNNNFTSKRGKLGYTLINSQKLPETVYEKRNPLNVTEATNKPLTLGGINYFSFDRFMPITPLENYTMYDVIIVSSLYAEAVKNSLMNFGDPILVDYLDRLYVLTEPISSEFSPCGDGRKNVIIGNGGLQKATGIKLPYFYNQDISANKKPSLISMIYSWQSSMNRCWQLRPDERYQMELLGQAIEQEINRRNYPQQ